MSVHVGITIDLGKQVIMMSVHVGIYDISVSHFDFPNISLVFMKRGINII
jgi:hypothetical protein